MSVTCIQFKSLYCAVRQFCYTISAPPAAHHYPCC